MIPGFNIYATARRLIGGSPYRHFSASRTVDDRGIYVTTYSSGTDLVDSIQAVPRKNYTYLGLDLSKYYIIIYTDNPIFVLERGTSGDQIEFNGERYQLLSNTDWVPIDGWQSVMAIRLSDTVTP